MVNFSLIHTGQQLIDESYVFSSHVKQVFYSKDPTNDGCGGTHKARKHTLLKDLYKLNPVERVKASRNSHGQPVGLEARLLAGYLGIIARNANMLPINYESWHQIPNSNKNQALYNIKDRFALEVLDNYVKKALGKKWKDHKSTLKKEYFKKNISLEEKLQNVPLGMLRYQWEDAVRFWNSKKGEDRERVGTTSRQNQKFTHTAGPKTFACVAEAEELSPGQKVGCLQLFDITHRKKDGSLMTSEAEEIMEKLKDKKAGYEAVASNDSSVNLEDIDNKVITEFLGPKSMREAEVERKYEELQLQLKAEAATREAKAVVREAEQSKKYNALQLQLRNMMKMF
ncbi:hypothetical protein PVK06_008680 [Gossypium arboreum]|uniref:Uncharacterized protein n=2 Tax=Gossypium arboreum TaxID=29729 RepID=A0ABR0QLP9_GOSAR|nr:hypothetical protein PVK06_008680 [Gossypium arboreum]